MDTSTVTGLMAARDAQWEAVSAAGPEAVAALRAEYAAAGWTLCEHDTCPPFDCRALNSRGETLAETWSRWGTEVNS